MKDFGDRVVDALTENHRVLAPTIRQLMAEAWDEGHERGALSQFEDATNPYALPKPVPKTPEEIAAFATDWDAKVVADRAKNNQGATK